MDPTRASIYTFISPPAAVPFFVERDPLKQHARTQVVFVCGLPRRSDIELDRFTFVGEI